MYLDVLVEIPNEKGKITFYSRGEISYVNYEVERVYDPVRKFNIPKRVTIGKLSNEDQTKMIPNHNFLMYFPDVVVPKQNINIERSACLRVGTYLVIAKVVHDLKITEKIAESFDEEESGLFLDLIACEITCANDAKIYYPLYAYEHPLFAQDMKIYDNAKVSGFLGRKIVKEYMKAFLPTIKDEIYTKIQDVLDRKVKNSNAISAQIAFRDLEKIELLRGQDQVYRLDHALTEMQESILEAFSMDISYVKAKIDHIKKQLIA